MSFDFLLDNQPVGYLRYDTSTAPAASSVPGVGVRPGSARECLRLSIDKFNDLLARRRQRLRVSVDLVRGTGRRNKMSAERKRGGKEKCKRKKASGTPKRSTESACGVLVTLSSSSILAQSAWIFVRVASDMVTNGIGVVISREVGRLARRSSGRRFFFGEKKPKTKIETDNTHTHTHTSLHTHTHLFTTRFPFSLLDWFPVFQFRFREIPRIAIFIIHCSARRIEARGGRVISHVIV